jgi:hypothetical protein
MFAGTHSAWPCDSFLNLQWHEEYYLVDTKNLRIWILKTPQIRDQKTIPRLSPNIALDSILLGLGTLPV